MKEIQLPDNYFGTDDHIIMDWAFSKRRPFFHRTLSRLSLAGHYGSCSMKIKKPDVVGSLIKFFEILIIPSLSVTWEEGGDQVQLPVVPPPCPILDPPHPDPTQCTTLTPLPTLPNSIPTPTILGPSCRKRVNCNRLTHSECCVIFVLHGTKAQSDLEEHNGGVAEWQWLWNVCVETCFHSPEEDQAV